jgi:hypothetical protein
MADLGYTQRAVSRLLGEIASHFKAPKVTLVVRNPEGEKALGTQDFVMTDDNLEEAIAALHRRAALSKPGEDERS